MSNTSTITPYEIEPASLNLAGTATLSCADMVAAAAMAGASGLYQAARWLATGRQLTPEELAEAETLGGFQMASLNLHLQEPTTLMSTARSLGYRTVDAQEPSLHGGTAPVLLENAIGERLAIMKNDHGRLSLHTAGDQALLHNLVSRHTEDRVLEHLKDKGMTLQLGRLGNGELQILAHEASGSPSDTAEIKTQVSRDGEVWVDIDHCRGRRCESIVQGIAEAVGGTVSTSAKKAAWYQLPGEPTKTRSKPRKPVKI